MDDKSFDYCTKKGNLPVLTVEIHPLQEDELIPVEHFLANSTKPSIHAERLARQQRGECVYLVAWRDNMPMGHLLVVWDGVPDIYLADKVESSPYFEDMRVLEEFRSLEVGRQLSEAAENIVRQEGYTSVGFVVLANNKRALALFERGGYVESDIGTFMANGSVTGDVESFAQQPQECIYMTKQLT